MPVLREWHRIVARRDASALAGVLAEDCVFLSPVVHTPQRGRDLTALYLAGAMQVFNESFAYTREVVQAPHAVLEFQCEVDGIVINGVDIITVDEEGLIQEFKVMIRPLKAIELMHAKMRAMLEQLSA
ncbi:nuclear transport factor 2 family protein [Parahaliea mediterranea]|uniref:Nuclear transport factor 2 family protein n=2 Tax=Parahaliea mediterranea TaxID=651086 RepID=A0A939IMH4_9GAMM|nr:nuclear transport factor 2 family protein [Parahaliea mediterranea]